MHSHEHNHSHPVSETLVAGRAFKIGITLNLLFVFAEAIAGFRYNSLALLTDAGHNLSDVGSLALSMFAFTLAKRRATSTFTYGYKKTTILAALVNAVMLFIAVGIMGYESVRRFFAPQAVSGEAVAWIAGIGILINGITAMLFFKEKGNDINLKSAYLHMAADTFVSMGAVAAGIIIIYTGWTRVDSVMGLAIAVIIFISTWKLLIESFKLSVDAVPAGIKVDEVKQRILNQAGVTNVHHIHIWPLSTTENALTAHITIDKALPFEQKMLVVKKVRHDLEHCNIHHSTIEVESGLENGDEKKCDN